MTLVALFAMTTGAKAQDVTWTYADVYSDMKTQLDADQAFTKDGVSMEWKFNTGEITRSYTITSTNFEITGGHGYFNFTAPDGKKFAKIVLNGTGDNFGYWNYVKTGEGSGNNIITWEDDEPAAVVNTGTGSWDFYLTNPTTFEFYFASDAPEVTISDDQTEAEFDMPSFDATLEYDIVRNMATKITVEMADRIRIQKVENNYVPVDPSAIYPTVTDNVDAQNPVELVFGTDYILTLQKKVEGENPTWEDATDLSDLSVGTFRLVITGKDDGNYGGVLYTGEFQLFEGYELTIPAGEFITYYKDEALYVDNDIAKLYTITDVSETTATATELTVAPALTPILVQNTAQTQQTILLIPTTSTDVVNFYAGFKGTLEASTIPASNASADRYAFNGKQFVWVKNALSVGANKAWLEIPAAASNARRLTLVFGDATKITTTDFTDYTDGDYYDLNGRKLQGVPTKKGVYILNGRKVVVK